jgi:anti-sigma factor RsiW
MLFCEDVELMLQDYLNGYLLPSQREVLEAHVRDCGECRALVSGLTRLDSRLDGIGEVEAPAGLSRSILAALPPQAYGASPLRRALSWAAVPALALLLVAAGFLAKGRFQLQDRFAQREVEVVFTAPQAASVTIVGDFNGWDPRRTQLVRSSHAGPWRARLKLAPGVYQYSFVLDGSDWVSDPLAKTMLADGFGGKNSVIIVDG